MTIALLAVGLVFAVEGLLLALAPKRLEEVLRFFASLDLAARRGFGLGALAFGVVLIWLSKG